MLHNRRVWSWHRWIGFLLLLPLLWWVGTGLVFALWSMERVRGAIFASKEEAPPSSLPSALSLPPAVLEGASALQVKQIEGHLVAIVERREGPRVFSLPEGALLGDALPAAWIESIARRDFAPEAEIAAVYFFPREGEGRQLSPAGEGAAVARPDEFGGPFPAYAVHFAHDSGMRLYLDGLSGQVRARRTEVWRWYDFAFRLHALDLIPEEWGELPKRVLFWAVALLWFAAGITGGVMWFRLVLRRRTPRPERSSSPRA